MDKKRYIALFNLEDEEQHVKLDPAQYEVEGAGVLEYDIPAHGVVMCEV